MLILIITICPIILCGCWNYSEIDTLAIVSGIAIDKDPISNKYIVTAEIITTQDPGTTSIISPELYSSQGDSILSAVRSMIETTGLKLFWSDTKVIIISESVANEGIIPVIDWTNRSSDLRPDMWMLISKENSAAEILKVKNKLNQVVSFRLDETMKSGTIRPRYPKSKIWLFVDDLSSEGKSQAVATVSNELYDGSMFSRVNGSAIFKSDKLVGYLDGKETLYTNFINNNIKEGVINFQNLSGSDTGITLELHESKTKLTPSYRNETASLLIDIYPVVTIEEITGSKDFINAENLKILQSEVEKTMANEMQFLINKLQKNYDSDILGFHEIFAKEKPKVYESFKKNRKNIFSNIKTRVNVHLIIKGTGKTNNSIPTTK
ncbi:Ger(x)C family spore germination protein [Clostridium algoriphilum]|uniref:Ger(x)C family spore germination protein n=1 Tax=Clostridium algoriphilum TaxID=198347 RepID=UPI001CF5884E|nr:Ger(x)C family spore germination protein [Clostridium algoriphilum]MCB2294711.1 Ger(x)C family spore germination protein [Clostridium algoriphilum]